MIGASNNIVSRAAKYAVNQILSNTKFDRRCSFYDLAAIPKDRWSSRSKIIQFYSAVPNIGNFLPVLGIQKMIDHETDTWNIHDKDIDYDFINKNYEFAIIGGAGLLNSTFNYFWKRFSEECTIPYIIWGVGCCFPDYNPARVVNKEIATPVFEEAELINLRDDISADYYNLSDVSITPCPTLAYLQEKEFDFSSRHILYSHHIRLVNKDEQREIYNLLKKQQEKLLFTDNIQHSLLGLDDIIEKYYVDSAVVVTTRLHGAIIAYSLKKPYIAIARDDKIRAFNRLYGNGLSLEKIGDLDEAIESINDIEMSEPDFASVHAFGNIAKSRIESICTI